MFDDLIELFSGWYSDFLDTVMSKFSTEVIIDGSDNVLSSTSKTLDVWSAYIPWEQLIAAVVLVVTICCVFRLLRSVLCKIL